MRTALSDKPPLWGHQDAIGDISVCRNEPAKRDSRRTSMQRTTNHSWAGVGRHGTRRGISLAGESLTTIDDMETVVHGGTQQGRGVAVVPL